MWSWLKSTGPTTVSHGAPLAMVSRTLLRSSVPAFSVGLLEDLQTSVGNGAGPTVRCSQVGERELPLMMILRAPTLGSQPPRPRMPLVFSLKALPNSANAVASAEEVDFGIVTLGDGGARQEKVSGG